MFTFPYEQKLIEEGEIIDPRIVLEVQTIRGYLAIKFLPDSGADVTTLPLDTYAELFAFCKKPREKVLIGGVEGIGVAGYPFSFVARLGTKEFRLRCYFIESQTDPLLGRLDFWDIFSLTFENRKLQTILVPLNGSSIKNLKHISHLAL